MTHYICTGGCGGVSEEIGTCQTETCDNWGEPLEECNCTDGTHQNKEGEEEGEEKEAKEE
ncbi:hypothetical protein A3B21_01435 [Candidatus Uhrbacteria bacterium RIFCSPLOWO2_01_FULL_47_24]|uniref:Uncharacterized protein n=1 Tax=Candidatus Uhrbacteria bacterium RIFCSPLOWO2_01_FULL_47_24 TaxID=1802401 RepID=A0A1F7UNS7_9BACT|nr:MAG: hypothetical protein A3D58_02810 [Candidatus Uhrbacteria bacterium RIFCSPHIGHO2_02_FULL_46_47]OGL76714.1 MAG: hypothetical protein A3F52_00435 [Candidatus Uhrbacteria bacterium RIFCSPHIGHO2_12_FULL_47_11]OGL79940.1 MAG: hypothetical protein A3B21_01435 [Candidatus Uhrbacteria bacterium RIFCSPLOWO2_01_FULL_47_24]OGL84197.1 MAG: hypothetical protein A3J03_02030 [Candidatus Uhrbacteria bacterium RIFCSPLOWO2_02_FULL_46_25]OGL93347.1 MAG: hypothetical protein A3H11_02495 [Candidatus Uhrbacte